MFVIFDYIIDFILKNLNYCCDYILHFFFPLSSIIGCILHENK